MKIKWSKILKMKSEKRMQININAFNEKRKQEECKRQVEEKYQEIKIQNDNREQTTQQTWNDIVETCKTSGEEALGIRSQKRDLKTLNYKNYQQNDIKSSKILKHAAIRQKEKE